uniref:MHC class I alpha antigen n=1 Tax=Trachinotus ovatus TaxID=173339 RepID=A0A1J0QXG2_TRAOV|nr:MHC class I alpha antigen [Trachinotus ovatus]
MKTFIFLVLLGIHGAAGVSHSLKYFYTASSGIPNFPEYVSVGLVDGEQISHCDSNTNRNVPKQDWMDKVLVDDPQYWDRQTQICVGNQPSFKANIQTVKQRFNQTGGIHLYQYMYGCEWDDETGELGGFRQYGYDGEDWRAWDMKTNTWVAAKQEAFSATNKWNSDKANLEYRKNYLAQICPEWLKKYVNYGKSSLLRKELPSVSLLQKSPSSPVSCHATGFYPDRALMLWRKDGEDLHEDMDQGEILPNHDGSFQMRVDLKLSSVKPEDWGRYDCVFQLSGVKEDIIMKLDKAVIRTNETSTPLIAIIIAAVVILAVIIGGVGFFLYRKKSAKPPPSPVNNPEVMEELNPKA